MDWSLMILVLCFIGAGLGGSNQRSKKCGEELRVGTCRASIPRWYFNSSSSTCHNFLYGGCNGNGNNFESAEQCRTACSGYTKAT
uniref:Pancreatic trypsin inhibitor n=1 Tax=Rhipicephalus zambeziensis TaxID=60191 RepID=A0A224YD32_9ACAR